MQRFKEAFGTIPRSQGQMQLKDKGKYIRAALIKCEGISSPSYQIPNNAKITKKLGTHLAQCITGFVEKRIPAGYMILLPQVLLHRATSKNHPRGEAKRIIAARLDALDSWRPGHEDDEALFNLINAYTKAHTLSAMSRLSVWPLLWGGSCS